MAERLARLYLKGQARPVLVFNSGRPTDFKDFTYLESVYDFTQDTPPGLYKTRGAPRSELNDIFEHLIQVKNFLLIVDDAKKITRAGLVEHLEEIMFSPDHTAHDLIFCYQDLNQPPSALFSYLTNAIQFRTMLKPNRKKKESIIEFHLMESLFYKLRKAPDYYYYYIDFLNQKYTFCKPINIKK